MALASHFMTVRGMVEHASAVARMPSALSAFTCAASRGMPVDGASAAAGVGARAGLVAVGGFAGAFAGVATGATTGTVAALGAKVGVGTATGAATGVTTGAATAGGFATTGAATGATTAGGFATTGAAAAFGGIATTGAGAAIGGTTATLGGAATGATMGAGSSGATGATATTAALAIASTRGDPIRSKRTSIGAQEVSDRRCRHSERPSMADYSLFSASIVSPNALQSQHYTIRQLAVDRQYYESSIGVHILNAKPEQVLEVLKL